MRICPQCQKEIYDEEAVFCSRCGTRIPDEFSDVKDVDEAPAVPLTYFSDLEKKMQKHLKSMSPVLDIFIRIFMILGTAVWALTPFVSLIGFPMLCWRIPLIIIVSLKMSHGQNTRLPLALCVLFFVNVIAGILLIYRPQCPTSDPALDKEK